MKLSTFYRVSALISLSHAFPFLSKASDATKEDDTISLTPGRGLPSLESLGLTVHDLLDPDFAKKHGSPSVDTTESSDGSNLVSSRDTSTAQYHPKCYHVNAATAKPATMCYNFLSHLGAQLCEATRNETYAIMCGATYHGTHAYVRGQPAPGVDEILLPCAQVVKGMNWIMQVCAQARCSDDSCPIGGINTAYGNGDMIFDLVGNYTENAE